MFLKLTLDFHCWWAQSKLPLTSLIEIWHKLKRKIIDSGHKGNSASNNAQKINHSIWQKCTFDSHPVSRRASLVAQRLKRLPAMQETRVWSLGREDPLEKEMATHSSTHAWEIPWTDEPSGLQSTGPQRVRHNWVTSLHCVKENHSIEPCPGNVHHQNHKGQWLW